MERGNNGAGSQVFINCPFDERFQPLFRAMVFVVKACGFIPRCALEEDNATEVRVEKIMRIIGDCELGIHDVSRTQCSGSPRLPRFNMPFELGLFLGAAKFGSAAQKKKSTLIFDVEKFRYQKFLSDIAGQDIKAHGENPKTIISTVRNWLNSRGTQVLPGGDALFKSYQHFTRDLPVILNDLDLRAKEITFFDWVKIIDQWLITAKAV